MFNQGKMALNEWFVVMPLSSSLVGNTILDFIPVLFLRTFHLSS